MVKGAKVRLIQVYADGKLIGEKITNISEGIERIAVDTSSEYSEVLVRASSEFGIIVEKKQKVICDKKPPEVNIKSVVDGSVVSGKMKVEIEAKDKNLRRVEIYINEEKIAVKEEEQITMMIDTTKYVDGQYKLKAIAYDAAGNMKEASITIRIDNTAPTVSITSPSNNAYVSGTINVEVSATDGNGISKVELYVNSTKVSEKTTAPYTFSLDTTKYSRGKNEIKAVAYDNSGKKGEATITLLTDNVLQSKTETGDPVSDLSFTQSATKSSILDRPTNETKQVSASINRQEGMLKWKFKTEGPIYSSPAVASDGTIYFGSFDYYLYAINPDGTLKWKFKTENSIDDSSPAIGPDGTIYIGSYDKYLYAVAPDGTLRWKFKTGSEICSSPAIGNDGTIYIASFDNYIYAISPNGQLKWKFKTEDKIESSISISNNGDIYVGSLDNHLYAIAPNGKLKWRFKTGNIIKSSPSIGKDNTIYVGSWDSYLYAINPDGTLKWKFKTGYMITSSPVIGLDGTIYVGCNDTNLYAITPDGQLKWKFKTGLTIHSTPLIGADGVIYVVSDDDYLYALLPDGTLKWKIPILLSYEYIDSSPALSPDGILYVGSEDGNLYAIYTSSFGLAESPWPKFRRNMRNTGNVKDTLQ
jgi:outer membrane protein assembly factor BamB